jgi:hypothetical protein
MATKIVDRTGRPFPTQELRRRMGFLGGDLLASQASEPPTLANVPDREARPRTLGGTEDETMMGGRP